MGRLHIRNCTQWTLKYYRDVAFHKDNFVAAGEEGSYVFGATYTLKAERANKHPVGTDSRHGVNQNGTYYAVWANNKIQILDVHQIHGWRNSDDNPYINKWVPTMTHEFPVDWEQIMTQNNTSDVSMTFSIEETKGFRNTSGTTVTVTDSQSTGIEVGAGVEVKGVDLSAEVTHATTHETITEHMEEKEIFGSTTVKKDYTLEPGHSIVVWQAYANVWGNKLYFDHVVYASIDDPKPDNPKFTHCSATFTKYT